MLRIPIPRCPVCDTVEVKRQRTEIDPTDKCGMKRFECPYCDIVFGVTYY
jgi:ribosomal protein L37AE/L43A